MWGIIDQSFPVILLYEQKKHTTTTATTIGNEISMDMVEFLQKKQHFLGAVGLLLVLT